MKLSDFFSERLKPVLLPALLVLTSIFLFIPHNVYILNTQDIVVPLAVLLSQNVAPFLSLLAVLCFPSLLLSNRFRQTYVVLVFLLGVLVWFQGNILVWNYGLFGKGTINWGAYAWRGWVDISVWMVSLIAGLYFQKHLYKHLRFVALVLISLQACYLAVTAVLKPGIWQENRVFKYLTSQPEGIYQFSSKKNVIHVILDEFQSDIFAKIIDSNPDYYFKELEGFTFFKEASGSFPTTIMSIPAFLSTKLYTSDTPIADFIDDAYKGKTIGKVLNASGYKVDIASSLEWYAKEKTDNFYYIPIPYGTTKEQYIGSNSAMLRSLVLFRAVPHPFKQFLIENRAYGSTITVSPNNDLTSYEAQRHLSHRQFFADLTERMSAKLADPVYKYIHLNTTHYPAVLTKTCDYAGTVLPWEWDNINNQDKCSLEAFLAFLRRLKALDIYDSSLIIVHADHGYWHVPDSASQVVLQNPDLPHGKFRSKEKFAQVASSSRPLLAIKRPFSKGLLSVSEAPVMLTDIPTTVTSALKLPPAFGGVSAFEMNPDASRLRKFTYYDDLNKNGEKYFMKLDHYSIAGPALDRKSWRLDEIEPLKSASYSANEIRFGSNESARFLRNGWGPSESSSTDGTFNWAIGRAASLFLSLPTDKALLLSANVKSLQQKTPQIVTVKVDGETVGRWTVPGTGAWENRDVLIMPRKHRPEISVVEFEFSRLGSPDKSEKRPLALLFRSIRSTTIDTSSIPMGTDTASFFLRSGWAPNESSSQDGTFNWALGKRATVMLPIPNNRETVLSARVKFLPQPLPQMVTVVVDGKVLDKWNVSNNGQWEEHRVGIPADSNRPELSTIEFQFAKNLQPEKNEKRPLALLFQKIELSR